MVRIYLRKSSESELQKTPERKRNGLNQENKTW